MRKILAKLLYWFHVIFMMSFLFSGFFLPLTWVVLIYLLIELSLNYYKAWPFTIIQERIDESWEEDAEFIPHFFAKYFRYDLSKKQYTWFSYFMMTAPVYVAVLRVLL